MVKRLTHDEYVKMIYDIVGDEYTILGEYINIRTKIKVRHNVCKNEYMVSPGSFKQGKRCRFCNGGVRKTNESFIQKVKNLVGDEYTVLGTYINNKTPISMIHNKCGHIYDVRPDLFHNGNRCPNCSRNRKPTTEEFYRRIREIDSDYELEPNQEYINNEIKLKFRHLTCNSIFEMRPQDFTNKRQRCPNCKPISKGEKVIEDFLIKNNIEYVTQYTDSRCKLTFPLKFDFGIYEDGKLKLLLEYDGEQHFEPRNFITLKDTRKTSLRDHLKNSFCKENNIDLIRINYKNLNHLDKILSNLLLFKESSTTIENYNLYAIINEKIYNDKLYYTNINKDYFKEIYNE
ncbi:hypothetical protein Goe21_02050 [Bacillus phage vB_BsuM-Goe21]|nr:hypothetical protein Goe21_02050 [Bacillus phage vB_BsuM-Goe21]